MAEIIKSSNSKGHPYCGSTLNHVRLMLKRFPDSSLLDNEKIRRIKRMATLSSIMPKMERLFQDRKARKYKINAGPIFIIGHGRSGTTFFHRLLAQDPQFGYLKTMHAFCPDYLLSQRLVTKFLVSEMLPSTRPVDLVKLGLHAPQEDEFALANMTHMSPYHGMYFPSLWDEYFLPYIRISNLPEPQVKAWLDKYEWLLTKLTCYWKGKTLISKNPPNTARIALLKRRFPHAKFVYLLRNPESVFPSMSKFMEGLLPQFMLEREWVSQDEFMGRRHYLKTMENVVNEAGSLPQEDFIGITYEHLKEKPLELLSLVYSKLNIPGFNKNNFEEYLNNQQGHQVQKHQVDQELKDYLGKEIYDIYEQHVKLCSRIP